MRFFASVLFTFSLLFLIQCTPYDDPPVDPKNLKPISTRLVQVARICIDEMRNPGTMEGALQRAGYRASDSRKSVSYGTNDLQPSQSDRNQNPGKITLSIETGRNLPIPFCEFRYGIYALDQAVREFDVMILQLKRGGFRAHPESTKNTPVLQFGGKTFVFSGKWDRTGYSKVRILDATGSY